MFPVGWQDGPAVPLTELKDAAWTARYADDPAPGSPLAFLKATLARKGHQSKPVLKTLTRLYPVSR